MFPGENNSTITNHKQISYVTVSGIILTEVMTISQNNRKTYFFTTPTIKENLLFQFLLSAVWLPYSVFYIELVHLDVTSTTQGLWIPVVVTCSRSIFSKS